MKLRLQGAAVVLVLLVVWWGWGVLGEHRQMVNALGLHGPIDTALHELEEMKAKVGDAKSDAKRLDDVDKRLAPLEQALSGDRLAGFDARLRELERRVDVLEGAGRR